MKKPEQTFGEGLGMGVHSRLYELYRKVVALYLVQQYPLVFQVLAFSATSTSNVNHTLRFRGSDLAYKL